MSSNTSTGSNTMTTSASATKTPAKRVSKKTDEAVVPAPVAAPAPAPVAEVKKVTKKVAKAAEVAPVVAAVVPATTASASAVPAAAEPAAEAPTQTVGDEIRSMVSALTTMRETISSLHGQLKKLEKRVAREIKDARKRKRRTQPALDANGEAKPARLSIFEIPTRLSDDLCHFLGKAKGTEMSRSNVTKAVTTYIKEKGLKNKHDIKPDAALKKLLAPPEGEPLTYFNLQKYLNKHYVKAEKPAVAAH